VTYRIYATQGCYYVDLERDSAADTFRVAARLRQLGWEVVVSR
jgi:hypothetical protein